MDAIELIEKLEEVIGKSKKIPFSSSFIINENEIYEILDELKNIMPEEFKQARWIVKERENMLEEAKRQSIRIVHDAEEKAESMISESEILKIAVKKADEIVSIAEAKARTVRLEAEDYADENLQGLKLCSIKYFLQLEKAESNSRHRLFQIINKNKIPALIYSPTFKKILELNNYFIMLYYLFCKIE